MRAWGTMSAMTKDNKFENILKCPVTGDSLRRISNAELSELNNRIQAGQINQRDGSTWSKCLQAALQVEGHAIYYAIEEDIYCLLPALALLGEGTQHFQKKEDGAVKASIQHFYDQIGWKAQQDQYQDAIDSEDLRTVSEQYITDCHLKINQHLPKHGRYLLDIASGPVQYQPYLTYSQNFEYRICADISITALREAKSKLKEKGLYLLCDITQLPIQNNQIEGIVSLHTIYHVPKDEQLQAFTELNRVLKPQGKCVVVYSWGGHSILMKLFLLPLKAFNYLKRSLSGNAERALYFHAYDHQWYLQEIKKRFQVELYAWRSVNVPFLKIFIHSCLGGKTLLAWLLKLENKLPALMGRIGAYPMFVFDKK